MKIDYDTVADAIYFTVRQGEVNKSVKLDERLVVDLSKSGEVLGMELLDASSEQGRELNKYIKEGVPVNIVSATPAKA